MTSPWECRMTQRHWWRPRGPWRNTLRRERETTSNKIQTKRALHSSRQIATTTEKNVSCNGCGLKGRQMKECNKTSTEDKKKIYSMKKVGTFEAKKTGFVNTVVEGTPGVNASAASSVTISGSEHNQYQHFLGVCREDPENLFSIGE